MFDKILSVFGLARKSELDSYISACSQLGAELQSCSEGILEVPEKLGELFDVSSGKMQEIHIDTGAFCSGIYHNYSPGVCGYSWKNPEELLQWLDGR